MKRGTSHGASLTLEEIIESRPFGIRFIEAGAVVDQFCLDDDAIRQHIIKAIFQHDAEVHTGADLSQSASMPIRRAFIHPYAFFIEDGNSSSILPELFRDDHSLGAFIDKQALETAGLLCPSTTLIVLPSDAKRHDDLACSAAAISPIVTTWRGQIAQATNLPLASAIVYRFPADSLAWRFFEHDQPNWLQLMPFVSQWSRSEERLILSNKEFRNRAATMQTWVNVNHASKLCGPQSFKYSTDATQLTVAISTYSANREQLLLDFIDSLDSWPIIKEIFVVWHDPSTKSLERMANFRKIIDAMGFKFKITLMPQTVRT